MSPQVSVVIPSRERPERLRKCIEQLQWVSPEVEIVVVADIGDDETAGVADELSCKLVISDEPLGPVHCWNIGAAQADGDYFVLGADDLVFKEGWLQAALREMAKLNWTGLVAFNDLSPNAGKLATHYMISKSYAANEWGGVMAIPAYYQHFIDTEATIRAQRDKCFAYAEDAVVEHEHWIWGKAENDDVYRNGQAHFEEGHQIYEERGKNGFPNTWEPYFKRIDSVVMPVGDAQGWGSVAIGLRSYRNCPSTFLTSWTMLLVAGLEKGDSVLTPAIHKPGHLAANQLARGFLASKCDSFLFIDDDMEFPFDSLRRLRRNQENWDYDIVQGFCTHKTIPPHAVVLELMENQPGPPKILKGEHYGSLANIEDNSIVKVDAVGLAFTLMKRHVLESAINEFGALWTPFFEWGKFEEGEDVKFSRWCRENGFTMAVDTSVKIGHLGEYSFGWESFQSYVQQLNQGKQI